jgi:hypothetical protein
MSRFHNIHTIKSHILRSMVIFMLVVLTLSSVSQATLIPFESHAWDDNPDTPHFILNGTPLAESKASESDNFIEGTFYWRQEFVRGENKTIKSIAFNGSAAENPHILLHVFSYTKHDDPSIFEATNTTSHTRRFILEPEDFGQTNIRRKKIKILSDVILKGFLVIVQDPETDTDTSGLKASFEVTVSRENGKKAFKGSVQLKTNKKGDVKIATGGKIKKKHIDSVNVIEDNIFQINFNNKSIPYKTKVKFGEEFSLITEVTGNTVNNGYGTGAEVIFGPGLPGEIPVPTIPTYHLSRNIFLIPEPSTIILLACGGLLILRPNPRKLRFGSRRQSI